MLSPPRTLPSGFIPQCLPTKAPRPPSGALWLHEIKHDGFQVIARKDGKRVKLYSRPGNDLTWRFSLIVEALGCGRDPALSTARRSHVTTAASRRSIVSDTAGMMPAWRTASALEIIIAHRVDSLKIRQRRADNARCLWNKKQNIENWERTTLSALLFGHVLDRKEVPISSFHHLERPLASSDNMVEYL